MNEILKEMTILLASKNFRFKMLSLEHLDELKGELIDCDFLEPIARKVDEDYIDCPNPHIR